ncbi:MAG TPA: hypothetical protein VKA34_16760, partial [Balneolales bacterium]|nr:hypothetical protein [Balneolales bacterium]
LYQSLRFRFIGPGGNRVSAVTGEPGNPNVYYAGGASGGVWKSTDGGTHWKPIFDQEDAQSIGTITVDPNHHHTIWVGTGETFIRSNVSIGDGIYKSVDGGRTWKHMGLEKSGRIGHVIVDPRNLNIVYASVMGNDYGPQQSKGVYKTTDGGKTWKRILFVNEHTGCSGLTMDPNNPNVLFAGMWQYVIKTWGQDSGGPGSGVYVTRNGGKTWKKLTKKNGLPGSPLGKIAVQVAPNNSNRVYALIETGGKRGSLWRSDDGGYHWHVENYSRLINERPHYYTRMLVDPSDYNTVWFPSNQLMVTHNGGETIKSIPYGGDNHIMWADPTNDKRMMLGFDGGVDISINHGRSWHPVVLPIGQMYHITVDNDVPYHVYSNMQDDESIMGPSNDLGDYGIPSPIWHTTSGCESGFTYPDTVNNKYVWGDCYSGEVEVYNRKTGHKRSVTPWPNKSLDSPAKVLKYRWNWTEPIAISPFNHNKVYMGSQYVHVTTNGGQSWKVISPDLTLDDTTRMGSSGGLTPDNLGVEYWGTLFAIAESPVKKGVIWAGSNDGLVHVTLNDGKTWENVTKNIPNLPKYGTISNIDPSRFNPGGAYISVDFHQVDNRKPYIYKTSDYGKHWTKITDGIPKSVFSYVHVVREDPHRKGLLFAGTENGIYVSFNDGKEWHPIQDNLPHVPVSWITIQPEFHDLDISTKGRGLYIMDDITPLEQMDSQILHSDVHLFNSRKAYRFRKTKTYRGSPVDNSRGKNPTYGASINYYLKRSTNKPVSIEIINSSGKVIRKITGSGLSGINRVWWNLRYPPTDQVKLRTTPKTASHVWQEYRFRGKKTREIYHWGINPAKRGPLVMPGEYTIRLKADGKVQTKTLRVCKDPNTLGTLDDVKAETDLWLKIYHNINEVVQMINHIELVRKQIQDLPVYFQGRSDSTVVSTLAGKLNQQALHVEHQLFQKYLATGVSKTYPAPMKLYQRFVWLAGEIGTGAGDVAGDQEDMKPTDQAVQVYHLLAKRLNKTKLEYETFINTDVNAFNQQLQQKHIQTVITPGK